jgi:hypothetical protein
MLVYPQGASTPVRGDLLQRVVLRTDLTPVPATVELAFRQDRETEAIVKDSTVRIGPDQIEFLVVKVSDPQDGSPVQGTRTTGVVKAIGLLKTCAAIASPLQRAVVKEGASLGEIYRSCGAQVRIDSDFTVPHYSAFVGMSPSFEIAKALQEEAGVLVYKGGRIQFRRLAELRAEKAERAMGDEACEVIQSGLIERQEVPFGVTTSPTGAFVIGRRESGRFAVYRPRADQRIVNNMSIALIMRRKTRTSLDLTYNAGTRVDVSGRPHIVITAAHVLDKNENEGVTENYTRLWLGEVVL